MKKPTNRTFEVMMVAIILGAGSFFASPGGGGKAIPGGPILSVFGEVIPIAAAMVAIYHGLICLRSPRWQTKLAALIAILLCSAAMGLILAGTIGFWLHPYARGRLIGW